MSLESLLARLLKDLLFLSIAAVRAGSFAFRVHLFVRFFTLGLRPDGEAFLNDVLDGGTGV